MSNIISKDDIRSCIDQNDWDTLDAIDKLKEYECFYLPKNKNILAMIFSERLWMEKKLSNIIKQLEEKLEITNIQAKIHKSRYRYYISFRKTPGFSTNCYLIKIKDQYVCVISKEILQILKNTKNN